MGYLNRRALGGKAGRDNAHNLPNSGIAFHRATRPRTTPIAVLLNEHRLADLSKPTRLSMRGLQSSEVPTSVTKMVMPSRVLESREDRESRRPVFRLR